METLNLSDQNLEKIPHHIFLLKDLKKLYLWNNNISNLPKEIKNLDLSSNMVKNVPSWLLNLENLRRLCIENNKIEKLPDELIKKIF
ncbi:MAG: hypothetical protein ACQERD_09170 [Campylobacterota bacterium]